MLTVPDTPASFQAHQLGSNSIKVSWTSVTKATGYHVRLVKDNQTMTVQYTDRNSTELTFSGLEVYREYSLSMIAVLKYLPSASTNVLRVFMKQGELLQRVAYHNMSHFTLCYIKQFNAAPNVTIQVTSPFSAHTGKTFSVMCTVRAGRPNEPLISRNVTVQWLNGRFPAQPIVEEEYTVWSVLTVDSLTHTLRIQELHSHHIGTYLCLVMVEDVLFEAFFTIPALKSEWRRACILLPVCV